MTTCAVPGRPHQALGRLQLCQSHFDEIGDWLHDIEREWERLDARPSMQANWGSSRGGSLASHQAPARVDPIVLGDTRHVPLVDLTSLVGRDGTLSAFDTLHGYAQIIRADREMRAPGEWVIEQLAPGPLCVRRCDHRSCNRMIYRYFRTYPQDVYTERSFLTRQLEWAAAQSWAGDLWEDVKKLREQLKAANGTSDPKPIPGSCPWMVAGRECGGRLWPVQATHSSETFVQGGSGWVQAIECETNHSHRWEDKHLIRLKLILEEQQRNRR